MEWKYLFLILITQCKCSRLPSFVFILAELYLNKPETKLQGNVFEVEQLKLEVKLSSILWIMFSSQTSKMLILMIKKN